MPKRRLSSRMRENPQDLLGSTAEAAFACDGVGRITAWNKAAEALFGRQASQVIGRRCFDVVRGKDLFGNRFCSRSCAVRKMLRHREPIHPYQLRVAAQSGGTLTAKCSIIIAPGSRTLPYSLIHLIQPVTSPETGCESAARCEPAQTSRSVVPSGAKPVSTGPIRSLTPREAQVLGFVASGTSTLEIARALSISSTTVCNHVQHILSKLAVHNKLQAVYVARRDNLI